MQQPQIQLKNRDFGISFQQEVKVNLMKLIKSLVASLPLSPALAHSQIILPQNSVGFVEFGKIVVTLDKSTTAPNDKIVTFIGDCVTAHDS